MTRQTPTSKLIDRINDELPDVPIDQESHVLFYRGPKDAGQYAWFTTGWPCVASAETVTNLLRAKGLSAFHDGGQWEIGSGALL